MSALNEEDYSTPAARDIIWRSRAPEAIPMLTALIKDSRTTDEERLRYFRAFDFHADEAEKGKQLAVLLDANHADQETISVLALNHLVDAKTEKEPAIVAELDRVLDQVNGKRAFLDLVNRFEPTGRGDQLFAMAGLDDEEMSRDATNLLLRLEGADRFAAFPRGQAQLATESAYWGSSDSRPVVASLAR